MRHFLAGVLCLALLLCSPPAKAGDTAEGLPWLGHTLQVLSITINPDFIIDNPSPETDQYVLLRITCPDCEIDVFDLIQNFEFFYLEDDEGEYYGAGGYIPYALTHNERNSIFVTAPLQPVIDLFFVIPADLDVTTLYLTVDDEYLSLEGVEQLTSSGPWGSSAE